MKRFTTSSPSFFDSIVDKIKVPRQIRFLLCQRCFWCASYIDVYNHKIAECPTCNGVKLESMPITDNEAYRFDYHPKIGVILEFFRIAERKGIEK